MEDSNNPIRIELAPQGKVEQFRPEVDEILFALGHPEALVTDLSTLGDFLDKIDCEASDTILDILSRAWDNDVIHTLSLTDELVSLARSIRRGRDGRR